MIERTPMTRVLRLSDEESFVVPLDGATRARVDAQVLQTPWASTTAPVLAIRAWTEAVGGRDFSTPKSIAGPGGYVSLTPDDLGGVSAIEVIVKDPINTQGTALVSVAIERET